MSAPSDAGESVSVSDERVADENHHRAGRLGLGDGCRVIAVDAQRIRPGNNERRGVVVDHVAVDFDAERLSAGARDVERLWMRRTRDRNLAALFTVMPVGDADRFGDRRRFVEQGGRSDRQARQFGDKCLEIEQHFQPALADFGLVGRVSGVPGRVLEQVALDHRRHDRPVIALADKALEHGVAAHHRSKFGQRLGFGCRRGKAKRPVEPDRLWHGLGDKGFH